MSGEDNLVQVDIQGRNYVLRGGDDPQSVRDLAAYVDERMSEIADHTRTADTTRLAILAALNIADELFQARSGVQPAQAQAPDPSERDAALCRILDQALS